MPVNSDSWIGFVPRQHQIDGPPGGAEGRILTRTAPSVLGAEYWRWLFRLIH